ncbi:MAG TPA: RNA polymerase sigma factor [Polyangiaceae bacterium]|nr:RNA polymerase sigma factor [Polyangiaceae bacterium]
MKASTESWPVPLPLREDAGAVATPDGLVGSMAQIYDAHFDFVWRNARRLGVPEASVDDVVQDVFVIVHRRIADFDGRRQLRAWIFGILTRVARDHRRSFRRKSARWISLEAETSPGSAWASPGPSPSELAERAERIRLLDTLLDRLDDDKRMLLVLSELEQWTLREIAEMLGSNTNTIHSRLRAAKRAFEKVYGSWLADGGDKS